MSKILQLQASVARKLYNQNNMSPEQIAAEMNRPLATVKQWLGMSLPSKVMQEVLTVKLMDGSTWRLAVPNPLSADDCTAIIDAISIYHEKNMQDNAPRLNLLETARKEAEEAEAEDENDYEEENNEPLPWEWGNEEESKEEARV